MNKDIA